MEENKTQVIQEAKTDSTADSFFSASQADAGMKDFLANMKQPREKVEAPPMLFEKEEEEISDIPEDPGAGETDDEMLNHFDYSEEHRYTAEFMLIQLDKDRKSVV